MDKIVIEGMRYEFLGYVTLSTMFIPTLYSCVSMDFLSMEKFKRVTT
jgi:hypothetical protein